MTKTELIIAKIGIAATLVASFCWGWLHQAIKDAV